MSTNKLYSIVLIIILIATPISLCSIDYYTDNGRDMRTHTGAPTGEPVCGYQYVSPTTVGAPPMMSLQNCIVPNLGILYVKLVLCINLKCLTMI